LVIKKGDFILVDYTGKVKETGAVFDTTSEDIAKSNKLYKEGDVYEPRLVVVGEGWVLKALDDSLITFKLKKNESVEISPENAFGNRDPEKVKLVPIKRLAARGISPRLGEQIEYDKRLATVRTMGSGRVTLDFNPPLAGKTLVYDVIIQKKLASKEKKISALIHRRIPSVDIEKFISEIAKTIVKIDIPVESFYVEGIQLAKRGIAMDIQRFLPKLTTVKFVESFIKPEADNQAKKKTKKKSSKKATRNKKDVPKKSKKKTSTTITEKKSAKTTKKKAAKKTPKTVKKES
jgi:peptidylprolyl isomerase